MGYIHTLIHTPLPDIDICRVLCCTLNLIAFLFSFYFFSFLFDCIVSIFKPFNPSNIVLVLICSKQRTVPACKGEDIQTYYHPLAPCISGTTSNRWIPVHARSDSLNSTDLLIHGKYFISFWLFCDTVCEPIFSILIFYCATGIHPDDFYEDSEFWRSSLRNYWSVLSPLIFSDHPKRPGDEDPLPPHNMVRNVMDMNAHYGGLNAALSETRKSAWVMNVVPLGVRNTLPLILDRGFLGVLHNW